MVEIKINEVGSLISREPVEEFIRLYKEEFGVELSDEKGKEEFCKICLLYKIIYLEK